MTVVIISPIEATLSAAVSTIGESGALLDEHVVVVGVITERQFADRQALRRSLPLLDTEYAISHAEESAARSAWQFARQTLTPSLVAAPSSRLSGLLRARTAVW